jgi:hypothetical protein
MVDVERREQSKKEMGGSLMFIGLAVCVADVLVAFFLAAVAKLGRQGTFLTVIVVVAR